MARIFLGFCGKFIRSAVDYCSNLFRLVRSPVFIGEGVQKGDGKPVFVIPGFLIGDISTVSIRLWLEQMGYRVYASGLSSCRGCPYLTAQLLEKKLLKIHKTTGQPVAIISYSLGGIMARFLASKHRDKVRHTITISSPSPDTQIDPFLHSLFKRLNPGCLDTCDCELMREFKTAPPISETLIYSKDDETVSWKGRNNGNNTTGIKDYHEISGRHGGLVVSPEAYKIIADSLSRH